MKDGTLITFLRAPVAGRVKTRLAATVGDARALDIYRRLLMHTLKTCAFLECEKEAWYADAVPEEELAEVFGFTALTQQGEDLGERMAHAIGSAFQHGRSPVVIIGTDCPGISEKLLHDAFSALKQNDAVIGPARDGGYWLLGMNRMIPDLFKGKKWSSSSVRADTIADLERLGLSFALLPELIDVDNEQDLNDTAHLFGDSN